MSTIRTIFIKNNTALVKNWVREFEPNEEFQIPQDTTAYFKYRVDSELFKSVASGDASIGNGAEYFTEVSEQMYWLVGWDNTTGKDEIGRQRIVIEPETHGASHAKDGIDEINVNDLNGVLADEQTPIPQKCIDAMGTKSNLNPLNHDKFQQSDISNLNETQVAFQNRIPTSNEKAAMDSSLSPSSVNAFLTKSKGDDEYAVKAHTHEGGTLIPPAPNDTKKNIIVEQNDVITWEELNSGNVIKRSFEIQVQQQASSSLSTGKWFNCACNNRASGSNSGYRANRVYPTMLPFKCKLVGLSIRIKGAEYNWRSTDGDLRYAVQLMSVTYNDADQVIVAKGIIPASYYGGYVDWEDIRGIDNSPEIVGTNVFQEGDLIGAKFSSAGSEPGDIYKLYNPTILLKFEEID